ncbi:MAG TPA: hydrogenase maturation nickel metallochaperone HypA [Candidatus Dormibacteraeota bacterium]|nr:hydrogenase maturation nickel metallochaperone HypA [Candidatus Dormibacteraeota bacterium]
MHELSIAQSIVEMVDEVAEREGAKRVSTINLRLGAMSSVVEEALLFSFDLVAAGTAAEGARLAVEKVPLVVFCPHCDAERTLSSPVFTCPLCGSPTHTVVSGKELEVTSVELAD